MPERVPPPIDFDREAIEQARQLTVEQRLALGGDLFDAACAVTLNFIHVQNPGISRAQALEILRQRLDFGRRLEARA